MVTREDANTLCKAVDTQCRMMYSSEFYLRYIHKYSLVIHTRLTFPDENHILFEKQRKRQIHWEAYTHTEVNRGEFIAKVYLLEYGVNIKAM